MTKNRHLMAVAAHLWLRDHEGRILFMRRCNTGYADGQWSVPAGHVEDGETIAEACVREAFEEIGVVIAIQDLEFDLLQHKRDIDGQQRMDVFFSANLPLGQHVRICEPSHCSGLTWASPSDPPAPLVQYVAGALSYYGDAGQKLAYWGFD